MRIDYDTEFLEDGRTIDLISIGMVADDGRELYAVSSEFDVGRVYQHEWLMDNVWPSLPKWKHERGTRCHVCRPDGPGHLDKDHPDVRPRAQIARMVSDFILATPEPELWAYYAAYDHVALCQLFGAMIDLPAGVPMQTDDIVTEAKRLGLTPRDLPQQPDGLHNALADARHNAVRGRFLAAYARERETGPALRGQYAGLLREFVALTDTLHHILKEGHDQVGPGLTCDGCRLADLATQALRDAGDRTTLRSHLGPEAP